MKTIQPLIIVLLASLFVLSCAHKNNPQAIDENTYASFMTNGQKIANQSQATLLSNVSKAIQQGGTAYAVEFCNTRASSITDSLSREYNCEISRVSDKFRNPDNQLTSDTEKQLWNWFSKSQENGAMHDTLVRDGNQLVYYKPIVTAMPTCLKCHGPMEEIDPTTYQKLELLYPNDHARGYELNQLRGLWKIAFNPD